MTGDRAGLEYDVKCDAELNPLEVRNLLGLISIHRRHRALLDAPVGRDTLQAWLAQAEALAPFNRAVRSERAWLGAAK